MSLSKKAKLYCRAYDKLYLETSRYIKTRCESDLKDDPGQRTRIETAISFCTGQAIERYFKNK